MHQTQGRDYELRYISHSSIFRWRLNRLKFQPIENSADRKQSEMWRNIAVLGLYIDVFLQKRQDSSIIEFKLQKILCTKDFPLTALSLKSGGWGATHTI